MVTTAATPITMPSKVRAVRNRFARSERSAVLTASPSSASKPAAPMPRCTDGASNWPLRLAAPSLTILPSAIVTMRWAWAAILSSWVISKMVRPSWCRAFNKAITSMPLWLSSAPVGSSARITGGSFTKARAMATRCCWPPESCIGFCSLRSAKPSLASNCKARCRRSGLLRPAYRAGISMFSAALAVFNRL